MACGVGACLSCAVMTTAGQKHACVDGPVFEVREVVW
ncbi:iron-sulfur cluster-binding protein [Oceanithermus sp.]